MALKGINVLDFTQFQNGPYATAWLADVGATVLKVEQPGVGDTGRGLGPIPFKDMKNDFSGYFESLNRGKKSIELDMKSPSSKPILERLIKWSDVICENFKVGTLDRLGWSYEVCRKINPKVIYCSNSGFGPEGPWAERGSFDAICQGMSGSMVEVGGGPSFDPAMMPFGAADNIGAMSFAFHISAAIIARERSADGLGQKLECSQLGAMVHFQNISNVISWNVGRQRDDGQKPMWDQVLISYYKCGDGKWLTCAPALAPAHWPKFCQAWGLENLMSDPKTADMTARRHNSGYFRQQVEERLATNTRDHWIEQLVKAGVPVGPVLNYEETKDNDQLRANNYVVDVEHEAHGKITTLGVAARYSSTPTPPIGTAPDLGEHTDEVLKELVGLDDKEIANLKAGHVITPNPKSYQAPAWIARHKWKKPRAKL